MTDHGYRFGDVVYVHFPYAEMQGEKLRPAVIISSPAYHACKPDLLVLNITTKLFPKEPAGEFVIEDWQAAGLDGAPVARLSSQRLW